MSGTAVTSGETAAKIEQALRVAELERRVADLEDLTRNLKAELFCLRSEHDGAPSDFSDPRLSDVIAITEQMFGTPEVNVLQDPEDPDTTFVVFTVKCNGDPSSLVDRQIEWHERVDAVPPGSSGRFRLSIVL